MRRSDLVRRLRKTHGEMRPHLLAAGIEPEKADQFVGAVEAKSDEAVAAYAEALAALKSPGGALAACLEIWTLKTPEWWSNMAMLGETDLREHKLLRPLAKRLRREWRALHGNGNGGKKTGGGEGDPEPDAADRDPAAVGGGPA